MSLKQRLTEKALELGFFILQTSPVSLRTVLRLPVRPPARNARAGTRAQTGVSGLRPSAVNMFVSSH